MKPDNTLTKSIFKELAFTKKEVQIIESVFYKEVIKKGTQLLQANAPGDTQYFVLEGCLRLFHMDTNGKDYTVQFAIQDWWISDATAFFYNTQATMNIETITDATIYKISRKDRDYLYQQVPKIESFFRKKLEKALASFQKRTVLNLSQTATERYIYFLKTYPNIESHIKNYHIASYLGITTESLSRIRKDLALI